MERPIYLTESDHLRLARLLDGHRSSPQSEPDNLSRLEEELARAEIVAPQDIPADVVTMNSRVRARDLDSGEVLVFSVVYPRDADVGAHRISVLAPIGAGVLGFRAGDTIEWPVPAGIRRLLLEEILYQPEASGDFEL